MLTDQISTMIAVLGFSQFLKRFDLTTPEALLFIRILYFSSNVLQLLAWYYVRRLIETKSKKEDRTTMIEVVESAKPFSGEPPKKTRMSIFDYDLSEAKKQFNSVITTLLMTSIMHFCFKFTPPLIIQSLLPWKNFFCLPVVKIRVLGYAAEGKLERPWKVSSPFGDLMNQMSEEQPKKEDAEEEVSDKKKAITANTSEKEESSSEAESKASGVKSRKPRKPRKEE